MRLNKKVSSGEGQRLGAEEKPRPVSMLTDGNKLAAAIYRTYF
jgi:hypothetical protein